MKLDIQFEMLRENAIAETYELFGPRYLLLALDLSEAIGKIDAEIKFYLAFVLKDYKDLILAGERQRVIDECIKDHDEWMKEVNAIRVDDELGARQNDMSFRGGNQTANDYCLEVFLAKLNLACAGAVRALESVSNDVKLDQQRSMRTESEFVDFLNPRGRSLMPFILKNYKNSRPAEVAKLLFAMSDLSCLEISMPGTGHQDNLHTALSNLLGDIGSRTGLNSALNRYNNPSAKEEGEVSKTRERIKLFLNSIKEQK
ncbi:hypothetical protein DYBT9623_00705 [Dyadobacter sp. CECT 9623]|uniref:Uncharacterized protein n=1 Tax=Dyadobacter linearis TaxID=2823330 RepID=A0ABM8UKT8_9BACT|nr:hypothetical protein [Dyadobacter sp. CECT 9623]CAG5067977.1 hypothetical protein DYBT9623_00705 [Dyadobacter sp. CECT 9623]